jgi:predicted nucleic acid-binding protein
MFIDSGIWIGAKLKRDRWHDQSVSIINKFLNKEIKIVYVTDYIVLESVNFLLRKAGFETALETLNLFLVHERVKIINVDEQLFKRASEILMSFPGLSLTDASIAITMEKLGIRKLYSFDGGFDRIEWIERLEG